MLKRVCMCMYALRTFKSFLAALRSDRLITVFIKTAISATTIIGVLCTGSECRKRETASQKMNKAMRTRDTELTSAARMPTR